MFTKRSKKMKLSRASILLLSLLLTLSTGCGVINQVRARNELNDGAKAYKERRFDEAEAHFASAMQLDPNQQITQLFMARTLHQQYLAKRDSQENIKKAEQAVDIYKKILTQTPNDRASNDAVTNLLLNLKGPEAQTEWLKQRSEDTRVANDGRAEAYTLLASREYTCTNEITEATKETVTKGKEAVYVFKKPANAEDFNKAKQCAANGVALIDKALQLEQNNDSTWSYKSSLLSQQARLAEMDGNTAEKDRLTNESNQAKVKFNALAKIKQEKKDAEDAAKKAKEDAEK